MRVLKLTSIILLAFIATRGYGETTPKTQEKEWLSLKTYYGPPNYGENPDTDAKEVLPVLILKVPVNVRGNPRSEESFDRRSVENIKEVQLVLTGSSKEFIDKTVLVEGTLFHAFTGHHHTDVLMSVRSIKLAP